MTGPEIRCRRDALGLTQAALEIGGRNYEAGIIGDAVTILCDGIQVGQGGWDGESITDCDADLGDDVYEALDEALSDALATPIARCGGCGDDLYEGHAVPTSEGGRMCATCAADARRGPPVTRAAR